MYKVENDSSTDDLDDVQTVRIPKVI